MKTSNKSHNIIFDLNIKESTIRNAYEGLFKNPCRFYNELKKAFIKVSELTSSDLVDSLIFQL